MLSTDFNGPSSWLYRKGNKRPVFFFISIEIADETEIKIMNANESE